MFHFSHALGGMQSMVSLREPAHRGQLFLGKKESCSHEEGRTPADAAWGPPPPRAPPLRLRSPQAADPWEQLSAESWGAGGRLPRDGRLAARRLAAVFRPPPGGPRGTSSSRPSPGNWSTRRPLLTASPRPSPPPPAASLRPPPRMTHPRTVSGSASGVSNHDRVKGEGQRPERPGPLPFSS